MQDALTTITKAAARESSSLGLQFLRNDLWQQHYFPVGMRGYLSGLDGKVDWMQARSSLLEIVEERSERRGSLDPEGKTESWERQVLDQAIARAWAQRNVDAAVDWFVQQPTAHGQPIDRTYNVLSSLPGEDRDRAVSWLEQHIGSERAPDELAVRYARGLPSQSSDLLRERLVQLPLPDESRDAVLSALVWNQSNKKSGPSLRLPAESVRDLIDAAQLTEEARSRWHAEVATVLK